MRVTMIKNKYGSFDDISNVAGVRSSDKMLFVGENPMMFMKKYVRELDVTGVEYVNDFSDCYYDRIFVDVDRPTPSMLLLLATMNRGTVTFFEEDDANRAELFSRIEEAWGPNVDVWELTSNMGKCLITNMRGCPQQDVR